MKRYLIGTLSVLTLLSLSGCGGSSTAQKALDAHDTSAPAPHKITRALAVDFDNPTTVSRVDRNSRLSITEVPGSGNIAIMVQTDRRATAHTEFFIDLDHDSTTGLQWTIRTNPRDVRAQEDGRVGADLMVVDGVVYYYNIHQRRWRSWYHNWQRLGRVLYTRDPENGTFIIELPRNLRTAWHAQADRNPEQIPGLVHQSPGDLDYDEVAARFDGHIRATVALLDEDWNLVQNFENEVEFAYDPGAITQRRDFIVNEDGENLLITLQSNEIGSDDFRHTDILIDADHSRDSGFNRSYGIGADYLIQGNHLYTHTGEGNGWRWQELGTITLNREGNTLTATIPLDQLNLQAESITIGARAINRAWATMRDFGTTTHTVGEIGDNGGDNGNNNGDNNGGPIIGEGYGIAVHTDDEAITVNVALNDGEEHFHSQIFIRDANVENGLNGYLVEDNMLYEYTGNGQNWRWRFVADITREIEENHLVITIPRNAVGIQGEMLVRARLLNNEWRVVRRINGVTVTAGNGGFDNQNFWFPAHNGDVIFIDAQLANITPNAHTQFFIRSENDHHRFGGYLFEDDRVYRYIGNGNNWRWEYIGESDYQRGDNDEVSISIPLNTIDIDGNIVVSLRTTDENWRNRREFGERHIEMN